MSISRSTEGSGDECVDELGSSSVRMDTRDDHPMLASVAIEVNTDGPHTRSLTGDGKMADRPAATFGAQCGAQVGLSRESDTEKKAYRLETPSGEAMSKGRSSQSQTAIFGDNELPGQCRASRELYGDTRGSRGAYWRDQDKWRYIDDSEDEEVTEKMVDKMRLELRRLESKRRSRGLSRQRADDRSVSRSGYATCSEDIDDSVGRYDVAEWKGATDVNDRRSYAEEGRNMSYDRRRRKAGLDYHEPSQGRSYDWRFVEEDVSRKSKDQMSPQVGRVVSQEDLRKGVRFEEDKEELGYKVNSELHMMTEAMKNLMSDSIQQAVRGAQSQIKTEYGEKHLDERKRSEPCRKKNVESDSESRSDEEAEEDYPSSGCKSKVKRRTRQLVRECTVDSGLEEKSKRKEQKETSVDDKVEKGSVQKGTKSDEETKAEFFEKMLSRRRKKGESLQRLFVDFRRMESVAFEGEKSKRNDFTAAEAFIAALNDETMQQRVRSRKPKDLEAAYLVALFEETEKTVDASSELGKGDTEVKKYTRGKAEGKSVRPKTQVSTDSREEKYRRKKVDSSGDEDETDKEEESKGSKKSKSETDDLECKGDKVKERIQRPEVATGPRFTRKEMLLEGYDGTTSLAVFLGKFENCSEHNGWSEDERVRHLINALKGTAAQLAPLKMRAGMTSAQLIEKLTVRYGTEDQVATYRVRFHSYKRQKGQTLQGLYLKVRRFGWLAYPGEGSVVFDAVSVDTFINALGDPAFELRLRDKEPKSLEEAYRMAERLEAYSRGRIGVQVDASPERDRFQHKVRGSKIKQYGEEESEEEDDVREVSKMRDEMREMMHELKCLSRLRSKAAAVDTMNSGRSQPQGRGYVCYGCGKEGHIKSRCPLYPNKENFDGGSGYNKGYDDRRQPTMRWTDKSQSSRPLECFRCGQSGHIARFCQSEMGQHKGAAEGDSVKVNSSSVKNPLKESRFPAYLRIGCDGLLADCLLDSGSEKSLFPRGLIRTRRIYETCIKVVAANGTDIEVLGQTTVVFKVGGKRFHACVLVSDEIQEPILGLDWMQENGMQWNFWDSTVVVRGWKFQLTSVDQGPAVVCSGTVAIKGKRVSQQDAVGSVDFTSKSHQS